MDMSERAHKLRSRILSDAAVEWADPSDLARMSLEKLHDANATTDRTLHSSGELRLHANIDESQAGLSSVSRLLGSFQSLVTTVGAARSGFRGLVGRFPQQVSSSMGLSMVARPEFGSVVITIAPDREAQEAELPSDQLPLGLTPQETKVDGALEETLDIIGSAAELGPDSSTSDFVRLLRERGPRVSSATKRILTVIAQADFDLDLAWFEPHKPARRATLTRAVAAHAAVAFKSNDLESEDTSVIGQVISAGHDKPLIVRNSSGEDVKILTKDLPYDAVSGLVIDNQIQVKVKAIIQSTVGGEPEVIYRAQQILTLDDEGHWTEG